MQTKARPSSMRCLNRMTIKFETYNLRDLRGFATCVINSKIFVAFEQTHYGLKEN